MRWLIGATQQSFPGSERGLSSEAFCALPRAREEPVTHLIFPSVIIARWVGDGVGGPNVTENQQIGISHNRNSDRPLAHELSMV